METHRVNNLLGYALPEFLHILVDVPQESVAGPTSQEDDRKETDTRAMYMAMAAKVR
jgi:hypothetical protein